jgi:acyl-[acyl-carrier-protein]-phospholipid O-acyltransferase / long-chain-fatty-acid--[acyl-carrier-protein] ligase
MREWTRTLCKCLLKWAFRIDVRGVTGQFDAARLVVISRQEASLSGLILSLFLPGQPCLVLSPEQIRSRFTRIWLKLVDHLVADYSDPDAMTAVAARITTGQPVLIFPEGRPVPPGRLLKIYDEAAELITRSGARVAPAWLEGASRMPGSAAEPCYRRQLLPRITLHVGAPETLPAGQAKETSATALRGMMQRLLFQAMPRQSLYAALLAASRQFGRRRPIAADMTQDEYCYGDLLKMTLALGRIVARRSEPGENIGILMPNLVTTLCLVIGASAMHRVPAMLNYTSGAAGIQDACDLAQVRTLITSRAFIKNAGLEESMARLHGLTLLYLEDLKQSLQLRDKLWLATQLYWPWHRASAHDPEIPAVVLFTSGSESKPKGVVLSHGAVLANIAQTRAVLDFTPEDHFMNALPVFHSFGLTVGALMPLIIGARLYLYPSPLHYRNIPEQIYRHQCTVLFGSSTFLGHYARYAHPYDFRQLRFAVAGAEKLSPAVRDAWMDKFGIRILEGYGVTETAPVLAVNTPMAARPGTVGQFVPGIEARLLPVEGLQSGGVLHVRGPNVMRGYYRHGRPGIIDPVRSVIGDGWYDTGDVAEIDADGYVSITGRVKRFAKIAGEMVALEKTQLLATLVSPDYQHASSAQADPGRGEQIILFTTDPALKRDQLVQLARVQGVPEIAVAKKIVRVDALPMLGTGKVDYVKLKQLVETV